MDRREFIGSAPLLLAGASGPPALAGQAGATGSPPPRDARSVHPALATEAWAQHAASLTFADLQAPTVERAKLRVLDLVGCAIAGARSPGTDALARLLQVQGGRGEAGLIGFPVRGPAAEVAMANAVIARGYDFEVMTVVVEGQQVASHHSPTTCMTALALSEREHRSGREFLTALVLGDDLCARLLAASGLDFGQGWDGAPIYSTLGATAIAAHLLHLQPAQVQDALGLALDTISGTVQNIWDGATDWKLPQGLAARNAVFATELARRGWVGVSDSLLAPYGFFRQYTAGCAHPELLTRGLGQQFYAEEYFKPYPACAATHPVIECALALRASEQFDVASIQQLVIRVPERSLSVFVSKPFELRRHPHCDANFSHQWQAAAALVHGSIRQEHYAPDAIAAPMLMQLISRSQLAAMPAGRGGFEIEARLQDGRVLRQAHSGTPQRNPSLGGSTREQVLAKFHQQVQFAGYLPPDAARQIVDRIDNLEHEKDMADLAVLLQRHALRL